MWCVTGEQCVVLLRALFAGYMIDMEQENRQYDISKHVEQTGLKIKMPDMMFVDKQTVKFWGVQMNQTVFNTINISALGKAHQWVKPIECCNQLCQ